MQKIIEAVAEYQRLEAEIHRMVLSTYPLGMVVRRSGDIWGIVFRIVGCRPGSVAILHENGNVWDVAVNLMSPVPDRDDWPEWVQRWVDGRAES